MKQLICVFIATLLTVGCRNEAPSVAPTSPSHSETSPVKPSMGTSTAAGANNTNQGGGVDSSGGDLLTSSAQDVEAALEQIEEKAYQVAFRMAYELNSPDKTEFEKIFGQNTYQLMRDLFIKRNRKGQLLAQALDEKSVRWNLQNEACESSTEHNKAGSAKWNSDGQAEVCLSKNHLRKMSPNSLQVDVLALAFHELSHLFDYDEEKAQAVQNFVLKNKGMVWPPADQTAEILETSNKLLRYYTRLIVALEDKDTKTLCDSVDSMMAGVLSIYRNRSETQTVVLPAKVIDAMQTTFPWADQGLKICREGDASKILPHTSQSAGRIFSEIVNVNTIVRLFVNPRNPGAYMPTFDMMNLMVALEQKEILAGINPKASPAQSIEMTDVYCKIKVAHKDGRLIHEYETAQVRQFYGDSNAGIGTIGDTNQGDNPYMFRRVKGQRGVGFAFMSKEFKVKKTKNLIPTNGGKVPYPIYVSMLSPGFIENFQYEAESEHNVLKVRCGYKSQGKVPDLTYVEEPMPASTQKDPNDDYFDLAPEKMTNLRIRFNKPGQNSVPGGEVFVATSILNVRYNGNIILISTADQCIIPHTLLEEKKINAQKLARDIQQGQFTEVICDMNGDRKGPHISHAAWAFDFSTK